MKIKMVPPFKKQMKKILNTCVINKTANSQWPIKYNKGMLVKVVGDHVFWSSTLFQNRAFNFSAKKYILRQKKNKIFHFMLFVSCQTLK